MKNLVGLVFGQNAEADSWPGQCKYKSRASINIKRQNWEKNMVPFVFGHAGARWDGLTILKSADLLGFSMHNILVYSKIKH